MKKIILSIGILLIVGVGGVFTYEKMTTTKTNYDFTHFKKIPDLVKEKENVIIFIVQDGCSYCKLVDPIVNDYASKNKGVVYAITANKEDDYSSQSIKYHIEGTPTLLYYHKGKEIYRTTNAFTSDEFQQTIQKVDF